MPLDGKSARRSSALDASTASSMSLDAVSTGSRSTLLDGRHSRLGRCSISPDGGTSPRRSSPDGISRRSNLLEGGKSNGFNSLVSQLMNGLGHLALKHEQEAGQLQREITELRKRLNTRQSLPACNAHGLNGALSTCKIDEEDLRSSPTCSGTGKDVDEDLESIFTVDMTDLYVPNEREPVQVVPGTQQRMAASRFSGFGQETDGGGSCSMILAEIGSLDHHNATGELFGFAASLKRGASFDPSSAQYENRRTSADLPMARYASDLHVARYQSRSSGGSMAGQGGRTNFAMKKTWTERPELWSILLSEELMQVYPGKDSVLLKSPIRRGSIESQGTTTSTQNDFFRLLQKLNSSDKWMFSPYKKARSLWLLLGALFVVSDVMMLPVNLCFDYDSNSLSRAWQLVPLVFWTVDIPFTFVTGFVKYGQLEMSPDTVARQYAKTWLSVDLFLVGPEWVIACLSMTSISSSLALKLARFLRLLRLAKLRPQIRRSAIYTYLCNTRMGAFKEIIKSTAMLFCGLHVLGCFWHALGNEPDSGWVHLNNLDSASASWRYVVSLNWACRRLHGMSSEVRLENSREFVLDALIVFGSVIVVALYIGQTTALSIARTNSIKHSLKRLGREYVRRYRVPPSVRAKLEQFLSARRMEVTAVSANEMRFLQELPSELREDLLYEARVPTLRVKTIFSDMAVTNSRALRRVCAHAISVVTAVHTEVIFDTGDVCSRMLFPTSGAFLYKRTKEEETLGKRTAICEAVLWTNWEHRGKLEATEESSLLALDAMGFGEVIVQYRSAYIHAAKYARRFIWHLNNLVFVANEAMVAVESIPLAGGHHMSDPTDSSIMAASRSERLWSALNDLLDFGDMAIWNLDQDLFDGEPNDHFVFISHYKVEAGTEATLIRDLFEQVLRHDPLHPAHNLMSPVFVDSEDLEDLACLQDHVKRSSNLLLLLTPGLLSRPWCLLEIIVALRSGVEIIPVEIQRPGFRYQFPEEEFYTELLSGKFLDDSARDLLHSQGIHLKEVEQAIRQVFNKIAMHFSPHKTKQVREAELQDILKRCSRSCHSSVLRPSV